MSPKGLILIPLSCEINLTQEAPLQWNIFGRYVFVVTFEQKLCIDFLSAATRPKRAEWPWKLKRDGSNLWLVTSQRPGFVSCKLSIYKKLLKISLVKNCPYWKILDPYQFSKLEITAIQSHWEHTVEHLIVNLNIIGVGEISTLLSLV